MAQRILFVSRYPPVHCGIAEYTRMLAAALLRVKPGIEVHVAATREAMLRDYRDNEILVDVHPVLGRCGDGSCRRALLSLLERLGGVDVVHLEHEYGIFGCNPEIFEAVAEARALGLAERVVVTLHTVYHHAHRECAVRVQERLAKMGIDAIIVHNVLQEFELVNQGVDPSVIHLVPHGTELNPFSSTPRREMLYEALGVEPPSVDALTLLLPGFIRRDKGVDILVAALRRVEGVHAIVAGEPRDPQLLEALRGCRRVTLIPRYLPSRSLQMLMAAVDAVILPYRDVPGSYSTSGVLHLAMGSFRPVIGSRAPRLLELYLYAPRATFHQGSVEEAARLLEDFARDPGGFEEEMGPLYSYAARTRWDSVARMHLEVYSV